MCVQMYFEDRVLSAMGSMTAANTRGNSEFQPMVHPPLNYFTNRFTKWRPMQPTGASYHLMGRFLMRHK